MITIRITDFKHDEFGFNIHIPRGGSLPVKKVLDLCSDYLKTLVSVSGEEFDDFQLPNGSIVIEFDNNVEVEW